MASPKVDRAREIARTLLEIEAVHLRPKQPFTWSSGMKSPIYCDNRLTMSFPAVRSMIADGFVSLITERFPDTEVIAGTATGAIPHAAWVADKMKLPMIYVRDKAKGHGKGNLIEGVLKPRQKVVVIEDLISTGASALKAALAVKEAGGEVPGVAAIFTYEFEGTPEAFADKGFDLHTLSNFSALVEAAEQMGTIDQDELALLHSWKQAPGAFGES